MPIQNSDSDSKTRSKADSKADSKTDSLTPLQRYLAKQAPQTSAAPAGSTARSIETSPVSSSMGSSVPAKTAGLKTKIDKSKTPAPTAELATRPAIGFNSAFFMWWAEDFAAKAKLWWRRQLQAWSQSPAVPPPSRPPVGEGASTSGVSRFDPAPGVNFTPQGLFPQADQPLTWAHAEFAVRFAASMIDLVILLAIRHFLRNDLLPNYAYEDDLMAWSGLRVIAVLCLPYYGWFYSRRGASPGKMVMGLKIVDARTGQYLTPLRAFFRETLGKAFSVVTMMIGFLMAAFRLDHKALHDLIFDTVVVRIPFSVANNSSR